MSNISNNTLPSGAGGILLCPESPWTPKCSGLKDASTLQKDWGGGTHPLGMLSSCDMCVVRAQRDRSAVPTSQGGIWAEGIEPAETLFYNSRRLMNGNLKPNQKKQTPHRKRRSRRGTVAGPSTRWHSVPLSSVFMWFHAVIEQGESPSFTGYISFHALSSFTITVLVSFPQGHGH